MCISNVVVVVEDLLHDSWCHSTTCNNVGSNKISPFTHTRGKIFYKSRLSAEAERKTSYAVVGGKGVPSSVIWNGNALKSTNQVSVPDTPGVLLSLRKNSMFIQFGPAPPRIPNTNSTIAIRINSFV